MSDVAYEEDRMASGDRCGNHEENDLQVASHTFFLDHSPYSLGIQ